MNHDNKTASIAKKQSNVITLQPKADIYESEDGATLYVDLPGVSKESLDLDVDKNVLTIKGKINLETVKNLNPANIDIQAEQFNRRFTLGEELDCSKIEATLEQGELKVFIPKLERHKPRKIEVMVA